MDIEAKNTIFRIPSFAKREMYDFSANDESLAIYRELNQIAEEIEKCRSKNI